MAVKRYISGMLIALLGASFLFGYAHAEEPLQANVVSITDNGKLTMAPGERMDVSVEIFNSGADTWRNEGPGYVSLYTYEPKYRSSVFDPGTWLWGDHVQRIRETEVKPGGKATLQFGLHAPQEEGDYTEVFQLASEDVAWITGGEIRLNIHVEAGADANVATPVAPSAADDSGLSAVVTVKSANSIKSTAGRSILFTAVFQNTGSKTWNSYGLVAPDMTIASGSSDFSHPSWNGSQLAYAAGQSVAPGESATIQFAFSAPQTNGNHVASFQLQANSTDVPDAVLEIPVEVTGGSAASAPRAIEAVEDTKTYIEEPMIRVGVLIVDEETDNEIVISGLESDFRLEDTNGALLAEYKKGTQVTAYYKGGKYYFEDANGTQTSLNGLRFVPSTDEAPLRVVNWDKRLTRGSTYADNEFRNVLELRYNDYKDRVWLINELGIDYYLRGLAETSDGHPIEMNKAQVTAARSYAYYNVVHGGKRTSEFMDLNSTPSDQYYLGYGQEKRAPHIVQAVNETRGELVMYNGVVAMTPYYARSNGSTKNWYDVWSGDQPYVRSVTVACDRGKTQWGHGLGMPQSGAECMAEDGSTWEEILKYFYTGITIDQLWK